jgi:hypothetical protein
MSAALTVFDLLTYAKTGILLILIEVVFYIVFYGAQPKNGIKSAKRMLVAWGALAMGFGGVVLYVVTHSDGILVQNYIVRFSAEDLWSGRLEVVSSYLNLALSDWTTLFVALPQSVYSKGLFLSQVAVVRYAHNIYIETICAFGWVTAVTIFIWIIGKIVEFLSWRNRCVYDLMPLAVLLASGVSLHGHSEWHYYFLVILALAFTSKRTSRSWVV